LTNKPYIVVVGRNKKMEKKLNDKEFIIRITQIIREQMLEYILWKITQYDSFQDFKEGIKKELCKLHEKNMKTINDDINGN